VPRPILEELEEEEEKKGFSNFSRDMLEEAEINYRTDPRKHTKQSF
jgi:hypothetical protein